MSKAITPLDYGELAILLEIVRRKVRYAASKAKRKSDKAVLRRTEKMCLGLQTKAVRKAHI